MKMTQIEGESALILTYGEATRILSSLEDAGKEFSDAADACTADEDTASCRDRASECDDLAGAISAAVTEHEESNQ